MRELTPGAPVERELSEGETHTYRIKLAAGQYLRVVVRRQSINVALALVGPDGQQMTKVERPNISQGPETILAVIEKGGEHRLLVSASGKAARGRYTVRIEELRKATAQDGDRVAAEKVFIEGERLRAQDTAESLRAAIGKLEEALKQLRAVGDRNREAETLNNIGLAHANLSENQRALEYHNLALSLKRTLEDSAGEAATLNHAGAAHLQLGAYQKALQGHQQALELARTAGDLREEAIALNGLGSAYSYLGENKKALEYYNQALPIIRTVGDRRGEATMFNNIGMAYARLGDRPKALEYFQQALRLHRETGYRREEATTLNNIGLQHFLSGDHRKALEQYNQALALRREAGDRHGEAPTLSNMGMVYSGLGDRQKALEYYRQSLSLRREVGDRGGEAQSLNNIGYAYWLLNEHQKALEHYEQSLAIKRKIGDRTGESNTLSNIGNVYASWGEHQKALERHEQALQINRTVADRAGEAGILSSMGRLYSSLGEYQKALDCFYQALPMMRQRGNRLQEADAHGAIGWVYWSLGQPRKALEHYNQALSLTRAMENRPGEAYALHLIGLAHMSLGEDQKAFDFFNQGLPISRALQYREPEARTLNGLGWAYWSVGQSQKALEHYTRALQLWRAAGDKLAEADTLDCIGLVHASLGQPRKALEYYGQALPLRQAMGERINRRYTLLGLALAERALGNFTEARAHIEAALGIVESLRTKVVTQDLRTSYFAANQYFYEPYIDLLMAMHARQPSEGHNAAALEACERARARSLLDSLIEARAGIRQGVDPQLLADERALGQRLNAKETYRIQLLSGKHTQEQVAAAENELKDLLAEYQNVQARIRAASPRYAALTQPEPLNLKEIQRQVLDDDTLLLEYALGKERSFLWAVTRKSIASFELPGREAIETAAQRVYELLNVSHQRQRRRESELAAADLGRMLLGPVANQLERKRLLIVADGALQYVPFAALPMPQTEGRRDGETEGWRDGEMERQRRRDNPQSAIRNPQSLTPLIVNHEIINLPSASTLAVLRQELAGRQPAARTVAVLADPVLQADDVRVKQAGAGMKKETGAAPATSVAGSAESDDMVRSAREAGVLSLGRLPFTRQEAEAILTLARDGKNLKALDFDANRATATSPDLAHYRIVHFATHGLINSRRPQLSGIVLSLVDVQGRPQDGFLRAHDIYNLQLGADLVVLSACQTALGEQVKGEGLVGLVRGFMYAGAPRVAASL